MERANNKWMVLIRLLHLSVKRLIMIYVEPGMTLSISGRDKQKAYPSTSHLQVEPI